MTGINVSPRFRDATWTKSVLFVVVLSLSTSIAAGQAARRDIPDLVKGPIEGAPSIWMADSLAVDSSGALTQRVSPAVRSILRDFDASRAEAAARGEIALSAGRAMDCGGIFM